MQRWGWTCGRVCTCPDDFAYCVFLLWTLTLSAHQPPTSPFIALFQSLCPREGWLGALLGSPFRGVRGQELVVPQNHDFPRAGGRGHLKLKACLEMGLRCPKFGLVMVAVVQILPIFLTPFAVMPIYTVYFVILSTLYPNHTTLTMTKMLNEPLDLQILCGLKVVRVPTLVLCFNSA